MVTFHIIIACKVKFTGQVWNMTFSFYYAVTTIPSERISKIG